MVDIDEWIPNFEMFVLLILPVLIVVTLAVLLLAWFMSRKNKGGTKDPMDWMDLFKFATAIYLLVPIWRIIDYIQGNVGFDDLVRGLFVTDFFNYMILCLITGIMGLLFILFHKANDWRLNI